jgi:thiol-disulfide isomerase/thioredoxin
MTRAQILELSAGVILLGGAVGAAAYWGRTVPAGRADAFPVARPAEPTAAWDLELPDLAGRPVRLRDLRGRVVLLNFWATWCPPCRDEMPALETLARELGPQGLTVVGVNLKESRSQIDAFVRERGLGFPVLRDAEGLVSERYQVFALPVTVRVDRRGMLVGTVLGIRDWVSSDARAYLGRLLAVPEA